MAMALIGLLSFMPTALTILREIPLATANLGLTWLLVGTPLGILGGGIVADRIQRHDRVAFAGMLLCGLMIAIAGLLQLPLAPTMGAFLAAGLFFGMALPSRDMVVRAITPKGASGKVFGFTYSGLDIGSSFSPVLFGWFVDMGHALWIFIFAPLFLFAAAATILTARLLTAR
jgi:MFS family permease